ncbi:hypothetical protein [Allosalinactinospora lopnorensis]|uniref:hypothetical protein n=1 Tax=Allosalinactinospora lopnorensis TaxID=1352348 RepID=UPI000623F84F|nr:hypothetical protein [Allosalinactinospora lopnorensis]
MYDHRLRTCAMIAIPHETSVRWLVGQCGEEVELSFGADSSAILDISYEMLAPIISALTRARTAAAEARAGEGLPG